MPYLNKRNRFVQAAKTYAEANNLSTFVFKKSDLLTVAQSINMKGIPTWVLKECPSPSNGLYDLANLVNPVSATV